MSKVINAEGKYLRLIAAGKMLSPDESVVKEFGLTENCYVHCVVTAAPPRLRLPSLTPVEQAAEDEVRVLRYVVLCRHPVLVFTSRCYQLQCFVVIRVCPDDRGCCCAEFSAQTMMFVHGAR